MNSTHRPASMSEPSGQRCGVDRGFDSPRRRRAADVGVTEPVAELAGHPGTRAAFSSRRPRRARRPVRSRSTGAPSSGRRPDPSTASASAAKLCVVLADEDGNFEWRGRSAAIDTSPNRARPPAGRRRHAPFPAPTPPSPGSAGERAADGRHRFAHCGHRRLRPAVVGALTQLDDPAVEGDDRDAPRLVIDGGTDESGPDGCGTRIVLGRRALAVGAEGSCRSTRRRPAGW